MSGYQMTDKEKRTVRLGAWLVIPALLFVFGFKPLRAMYVESREQLTFEQEALERERGAIAASRKNPELQKVADSLMQQAVPRLFSGRDDVAASAELVAYLDELAGSHHVLLDEDATRPATKAANGVRTLNVEIRGESDLHGILDFLQQIERGKKLLVVQRLDLSRPSRDADDVETISFTATISGFALVESTTNPASKPVSTAAQSTSAASRGGAP